MQERKFRLTSTLWMLDQNVPTARNNGRGARQLSDGGMSWYMT